jgi:hypothetical protein
MNKITLKNYAFLALGIVTFLMPMFTYAYVYNGWKWPTNAVTVDFGSPTIPSTWISPIAAGSAAWNAASSPFNFSAGTSNNDITVSNLGSSGPLAVTAITHSGSTITDTDLTFNSSYSWSTTGASGLYDVRNVATHEFGHFLSLADLSGAGDTNKTMYYAADPGETKKRSLHSDDIDGINAIYP